MDREITVTYDPKYIEQATSYFYRKRFFQYPATFLLVTVLLVFCIYWTGWNNWAVGVLSTVLYICVLFWVRSYREYRAIVKKYRKEGAPQRSFRFFDDGISWKSEKGSWELPWKSVTALHRLPGLWLLSLNTGVYIPLPPNLLDEEFKSFLLSKEPPPLPKQWFKGVKDSLLVILAAAGTMAVIALGVIFWNHPSIADNEMEFRGQKFKLTKAYSDYDDYKNDPNNLAPEEIPRIEKIILNIRIGPVFKDMTEFIEAADECLFPGYGTSGIPDADHIGEISAPKVFGVGIEIPRRDEDRYFFVCRYENHYRLVDDFVLQYSQGIIVKVRLNGKKLLYIDGKDRVIKEKEI